jgi:pantoate--beta-alanine ligase
MITSLPSPLEAANWCNSQRQNGRSIGFVPTMGALHAGHLSLVAQALIDNDRCCASLFLNPLQFNSNSDLAGYPADFDQDVAMLDSAGCHMVFTGTLQDFFPGHEDMKDIPLRDPGPCGLGLEAEFRPGHLEGVVTIVEQLFATSGSCNAYFGEKDYQQTLVIRDLAKELRPGGTDVNVVICPTIREDSGLALSSRNQRLSAEQQESALNLYRGLCAARDAWSRGTRDPRRLENIIRELLDAAGVVFDYASIRDDDNWTSHTPVHEISRARALVAASVGDIRLIDNLFLGIR